MNPIKHNAEDFKKIKMWYNLSSVDGSAGTYSSWSGWHSVSSKEGGMAAMVADVSKGSTLIEIKKTDGYNNAECTACHKQTNNMYVLVYKREHSSHSDGRDGLEALTVAACNDECFNYALFKYGVA